MKIEKIDRNFERRDFRYDENSDRRRAACTVDCTHPTDLGFYLMAKGIFSMPKSLLEGKQP